MFLILYPRQPVLLLVFSALLFLFSFCWFFFLFFGGSPGTTGPVTQHVYLAFGCKNTDWLHSMSTLPLDVKILTAYTACLPCLWM